MHIDLPAILRCLNCKQEGLTLAANPKTATLNGIESVLEGQVVCPRCRVIYYVQDGIINFLPRWTPNIGIGQFTNQFKLVAWGYERFWRPKALTLMGGRDWPPEEELSTIVAMLESETDTQATHNEIAFYLDQGCSTCFYARGIIRAHWLGKLPGSTQASHAVGVDNSWVMLQEARQFIERDGLSGYISLVRADVENLPFIDGTFAGTASGGSLNEFKHSEPALREANRTLDRNGNAAFMVQMTAPGKKGAFINKFITLTSGIKFFAPDRLISLFQQAGFELVKQESGGIITINHIRKHN